MHKHHPGGLALSVLVLATLACSTFFPPRPTIEWDTSPDAIIVESYTAGGLVPQNFALNQIPDARVWGDGRIVWVEYASGGGRRVLEGHLTPDEMTALLERFVEAGFFGWDDFYQPSYQVFDAGTTTLRVNLLGTQKSVSEYFEGAPPKFAELAAWLAQGAGVSGANFVPTRAYLTALPITSAQPPDYNWPDEAAGFTLAEAASGRYVEGEALTHAWQIVNQNMYAVVRSGGQTYQLVVQVPGLALVEPPAP
jgi:hypothetical protein